MKTLSYVICGIGGMIAGVVLMAPYVKTQYYQGRIDACEELQGELIKIRDELIKCKEKAEEL